MKAGTKELKNRLSHYLRLVRRGELVRVTDRGRVVAELRGVEADDDGDERLKLRALENAGVVTLGGGKFADLAPARPRKSLHASKLILDSRR